MAAFSPQCLLLSGLLMVVSEGRAETPSVLLANPREDTTLQCVDSNVINPKSCHRFRWMKLSSEGQTEVILSWPKNNPHSSRVKLEVEGQMSLTVMNVEKSDEGLYSCEMCQGWDCTLFNRIHLRVRDCKLLPPAIAALGKPFKLDCPVDVTQRPQNIGWVLLRGGTAQPPDSERVELNGTSLIIHSIVDSDSTWYRCNYTQTHRCYEIKVILQAETNTETLDGEKESKGRLATVLSSVIIFIVLVAAATGVLVYRFCKTRRIPQQTQGSPGTSVDTAYETVLCSRDHAIQQDDSLYEEFRGENMWSFK